MNNAQSDNVINARRQMRPIAQNLSKQLRENMRKAVKNGWDYLLYQERKDIGFGEPYINLTIPEVIRLYKVLRVADLQYFLNQLSGDLSENPVFQRRSYFLTAFSSPFAVSDGLAVVVDRAIYNNFLLIMNYWKDADLDSDLEKIFSLLRDCGYGDAFY